MEARWMMPLNVFKEHVLKDKTIDELYELVEGFRIEKVFLKVQKEKENIGTFEFPSEEMIEKVDSYREYIKETYSYIEELDGKVKRADAEEVAWKFQVNLSNIQKVEYSIGGYFGGFDEYVLIFEEEQVHVTLNNSQLAFDRRNARVDKESFLKEFSDLHIGEWRESYLDSDYGNQVLDGTSWGLKVYYSDEREFVEFGGSNAFPYNFALFNQLVENIFDEENNANERDDRNIEFS